MKSGFHTRRYALAVLAAVIAATMSLTGTSGRAQTQTPPPAEQSQSPATPGATPAPATAAPATAKLPEGQIEQLVAPIALYPDALLSQVLMASTYPLEVVEAARWSKANPGVKGQALEEAMQKQKWDPSVKALAAVQQTLAMMSDKLDWMQQLGDAFLAQEEDVMNAVQKLRQRAEAAGNLKSTPQQKVSRAAPPAGYTAPAGMQPPIVIDPVDPDEYYVPVYDPAVVYGAWDYPAYEPFYWYPPGYVAAGVIGFTAAVAVGYAIWGGCDWWRRGVNVNVARYNRFNRTNIASNAWVHNPVHRGNVAYRDSGVAARFGQGNTAAAREAARNRGNVGQRDLSKGGAGALSKGAAGAAAKNIGARRDGNRPANISRGSGNKQISRARSGGRPSAARAINRPSMSARANVGGARVSAMRAGGGGAAMRGGGGFRGGGGAAMRGGGGRRR